MLTLLGKLHCNKNPVTLQSDVLIAQPDPSRKQGPTERRVKQRYHWLNMPPKTVTKHFH